MFKKLNLKWRFFSVLLGFSALLLIILWLFQMVFLESFYKGIKVSEIERSAKYIINNIQNNDFNSLINDTSSRSESVIEVFGSSGNVIYTSGMSQFNLMHNEKIDFIDKASKNHGEYYQYMNFDSKPKNIKVINDIKEVKDDDFKRIENFNRAPLKTLVYVRLFDNAALGGKCAVVICSIISPVNATVTTLRYQLYYITIIMIVLALILALLISKRVSKPIEEINKSAKVLSTGNYNVKFKGEGYLEIKELSDTLNTAATELNKVECLRRELIANISHDLRTPLALIYSYAEMMNDFPDEISSEQTQIIMDEISRLTSLVNDVLDISKFESGNEKLKIEKFNITQSIRTTTERISKLVQKDGYKLIFNSDQDIFIEGDEIKIIQSFYNLLVNAINYAGADKTVIITQKMSNNKVRIEVKDNGEGIDGKIIPHIWDRYYKSNKVHKRGITGTGLGLSIVKKIIDLHNGNCGVISKVGEGSTFWFEV